MKLETNMRAYIHGDRLSEQFAQDSLILREWGVPVDKEYAINPSSLCTVVKSEKELMNNAFSSNSSTQLKNHKWLSERAILAPYVTETTVEQAIMYSLLEFH